MREFKVGDAVRYAGRRYTVTAMLPPDQCIVTDGRVGVVMLTFHLERDDGIAGNPDGGEVVVMGSVGNFGSRYTTRAHAGTCAGELPSDRGSGERSVNMEELDDALRVKLTDIDAMMNGPARHDPWRWLWLKDFRAKLVLWHEMHASKLVNSLDCEVVNSPATNLDPPS